MAQAEDEQKEIEVILTRQLASYLAMPIFVQDPDGTLIYYNEPAEAILGMRYDEVGEITAEEWMRTFQVTDDQGNWLTMDSVPVGAALVDRRPAHGSLWLRGTHDERRRIEVTTFPLIGQADRFLGVVGIFWEATSE